MQLRKRLVAMGVATFAVVGLGASGSASAAFPDFSDCPRSSVTLCLTIEGTGGSMTIKDTTVPLGASLAIRGGLVPNPRTGTLDFIPPTGTNGFFARPINIPGGLLGIDFPIPGNAVTATAELAGPTSSIHINPLTFAVSFPLKLKLANPILGPWCQIGTDSNPVNLNLIQGTTSPPLPNTPISGRRGTAAHTERYLAFVNNLNVDNSFAVPGASSCGIGLGLVNGLVNLKLGLPSAAGNNEIQSINSLAIGSAGLV